MLGFMTFIDKDGNYIGGFLGTDDELLPVKFLRTGPVKQATNFQKILYGVKFEAKWFGDFIAGTLFDGFMSHKTAETPALEAIFVSHAEMLHLRRKTGEIPVVHMQADGKILTYENDGRDAERGSLLLKKVGRPSDIEEVFKRVKAGIEECLSSPDRDK
jgi:hypothetical protein